MEVKVINRGQEEIFYDLVIEDGNHKNHAVQAARLVSGAFNVVTIDNPLWDAAPEMLEALKELSDLFGFEPLPLDAVGIEFEIDDLKGTSPHIESINKAFKRALDVLSKAEGRQS